MPSQVTHLKVFIASPGDVKEERVIARRVVFDWYDLHAEHEGKVALPVMW